VSLRRELATAQAKIVELEARLGKNSQNSSKPPSSDPPGTPRPRHKKRRRRKRGGQPGHEAHGAGEPDHVDKVIAYRASACDFCQAALPEVALTGAFESHYVYALPEIRPVVTDHRCLDALCPRCGKVTRASLPPDVPTGQYDPSVQAMTGFVRGELKQSVRQTSAVMTNLMHVPMSTGMVAKTQHQVSQALAAPCAEALAYVQAHDRVHADETSWRENLKKAWLWVAATALVTVFLIRTSRGATAARDLLGASFLGILTTDRWASYNWVATMRRQLCWSHLKRDFTSFLDYGPEAKRLGQRLLCEKNKMFRLWHRVRDGTLGRAAFQLAMKPVRRRMLALLEEGRGVPCAKVRGMCKEILKLSDALFTFVDVEGVQPSNNAAERAIRFAVLWRKGSFGSDSACGSRFVERFLTVRATLRSQGRDLYAYLKHACTAALHGTAPLSLLPAEAPDATEAMLPAA
jgi:transposase